MKKYLIVIILFCSFTSVYAQDIESLSQSLGINITYNSNLNDIARAYVSWGVRYVEINPVVFDAQVWQVQYFFYAHECAHHYLGHTVGYGHPLFNEQAADCEAIRYLIYYGYFTYNDILILQDYLSRCPGDWTHKPGPQRANDLIYCY